MNTAHPPNWPPPKRANRWQNTALKCMRVQAESRKGSACRLTTSGARPPAKPRADPTFCRAAARGRTDPRSERKTGLFQRRRTVFAGSLYRRDLPQLRLRQGARRSMRKLHQTAGSDRPGRATSAISGSTDLEVRETKHLFLRQSELKDDLTHGSTAKKTGRS